MRIVTNYLFLVCFLLSFQGFAQNINQYDQQGRRNGLWKKYYKNSHQLRYKGHFKHGKEIGTFKFYKRNNQEHPAATKTYVPDSDTIRIKFFTPQGHLLIVGQAIGKAKTGWWKYYRKENPKVLIMKEHYQNGKLDGWKSIYFPNGDPMEKRHYQNGLREGNRFIYAKSGQLLKAYHYKNDTLQGISRFFDQNGNLMLEGNYTDGKRNGVWKFYTNGRLDSIQKFPAQTPVTRRLKKQ